MRHTAGTNSQSRTAVPHALANGRIFFIDIAHNQVDLVSLRLLRYLATCGKEATVSREALHRQCPDQLDTVLERLLRRELIEQTEA